MPGMKPDERLNSFKTVIRSFKALSLSRLSNSHHGKNSLYKYLPLSEEEIRLLRVKNKKGEVFYDLIHAPFDKAPPYTALSYCWEDQMPDQTLNCGGSTLLITANVKNFLSYFSTDVGPHYIWIDGVCINQIDISEKNHQVSFMKLIYTKASNVVIWLGESEEGIDVAIRQIPEILELAEDYVGPRDGHVDALEMYGIPIGKGLFWKGIEALHSKPWFSRLWIFQEAVLAKNLEIRCGSNVLSYDLMTDFTRAVSTGGNPLSLYRDYSESVLSSRPPGRRTWMRIAQCRELIASKPNSMLSFNMLLSYGRDLSASNPADKIYGMLGLVNPRMQHLVSIDYGRNYLDVFIDVMKMGVAEAGESRLLDLANEHTEGLPTWCPNFATYTETVSIANYLGCTFSAGYPIKRPLQPFSATLQLDKAVSDQRKLALRGFFLDAISTTVLFPIGTGTTGSSTENRRFIGVIDWEATCLDISRSVFNRPDDTLDAHVRTLTGGRARKGASEDDDHELLMSYMAIKYDNGSSQKQYRNFESLGNRQKERGEYLHWRLTYICQKRSFFSTENGRIGLAPRLARQGDKICIFYGGISPYIIRPTEEDPTHYKLMGEAYVDGVMYGEALELEESKAAETIILI